MARTTVFAHIQIVMISGTSLPLGMLVNLKSRGCGMLRRVNTATRMSHVWYHADRHEQWERVTYPAVFCSGPKTGAGVENVSRPITDLKRGQ